MLFAARLKNAFCRLLLEHAYCEFALNLDYRLLILPLYRLPIATGNSGVQKFIIVCQHVGSLLLLLRAAFKGLACSFVSASGLR